MSLLGFMAQLVNARYETFLDMTSVLCPVPDILNIRVTGAGAGFRGQTRAAPMNVRRGPAYGSYCTTLGSV
jgi:hypothetical protein